MADRVQLRPIVYAAGKDVTQEAGCGHASYVRAHGLAAREAGFEPHIFCVGRSSGVVETTFGTVHRIRASFSFMPQKQGIGYRTIYAPFQFGPMKRHILQFVARHPEAHLFHGFGAYAPTAVDVCRHLQQEGRKAWSIVSMYTTQRHESEAKVASLSSAHGALYNTSAWLEHLWRLHVIRRSERRALDGADSVIVNYRSVERVLRREGYAPPSLTILPYTSEHTFSASPEVTSARFSTPSNPPTPESNALPIVMSVSRHDLRKGVDVLLQALGMLRNQGVPFMARIVGSGPLLYHHRKLAVALGLEKNVSIPGYVKDIAAEYERADVFVLPSLEEGSGSVSLIEATHAGLPLVVSRIDGIPEDVSEMQGLLVPPGDVTALAGALRTILTDSDLRSKMSALSQEVFATRFAPERFVCALRNHYEKLLEY